MSQTAHEPPRVIRANSGKVHEDTLSPGCMFAGLVQGEKQQLGHYFMAPGAKTNVFSLEDQDDGKAEEYYGAVDEFYYILVGEFTMFWGIDADRVRDGRSESLLLKPGDLGYWARGWKYSVRNSGAAPGTFFWGLTLPPADSPRREFTWEPPPGGARSR